MLTIQSTKLLTNKGSFNKDARFLNVNKTSCVWDPLNFFLFERIFYGIKYGI